MVEVTKRDEAILDWLSGNESIPTEVLTSGNRAGSVLVDWSRALAEREAEAKPSASVLMTAEPRARR